MSVNISNLDSTSLQQQASDPTASVFVSASAGTGKTKILCDRFIRLMLCGVAPENILCLTFTNAAATEMQTRIKKQIKLWSQQTDEELLKADYIKLTGAEPSIPDLNNIRGLYSRFKGVIDKIKINTIHAFCLNLLQQFSYLEKNKIEIIDDIRKAELFSRAFYKAVESNDELDLKAIDILTDHYDFGPLKKFLEEVIISNKLKFENYIQKFKTPLDLQAKIYKVHGADKKTRAGALEKIYIQQATERLKNLAAILAVEEEPLGRKICAALDNSDFMAVCDILHNENGILKKNILRKELREKFVTFYQIFETESQHIKQFGDIYKSQMCADLNFALSLLSLKVYDQFESLKEKKNWVEYDDLIKRTIKLLNHFEYSQWVLYNVDQRIDHILIDEAQDLSPLQWKLIQIISEEFFAGLTAKENLRTIFIVGDYKQSIYSFQGAEPIIFNKIRRYYANKLHDAQKPWRDIEMNTSFRTTLPALKLVDLIFNEPNINAAVSASPNPVEHLPFRVGSGNCKIWELEEKNATEPKQEGWQFPQMEPKASNPKFKLASVIAQHVTGWIENGRLLHGYRRAIKPEDIMILVRKRSNFTKILGAELKKRNVSVVDQNFYSYEDELIFQDLVSLANFVINPADDFNLVCLLKSPIVGISEEDLYKLCYKREGNVWKALTMFPAIHSYLTELLTRVRTQNVLRFFYSVLKTDAKSIDFIKRFGKRASLVMDNFYFLIQKYESQYIQSLYGFITWLQNPSIRIKDPITSDNAIKIMTVHSAKGLQSPIVILADAASSEHAPLQQVFWLDQNQSANDLNSDYWMIFSSYKKFDDTLNARIKELNKSKYSDENYRLLYVALTRAEDEVYVAGWGNNKAAQSWYNVIKKQLCGFEQPADEFSPNALPSAEMNEPLPSFLYEKNIVVEDEEAILPTTSSVLKTAAMLEGEVIHQLLQYMPKINETNLAIMIATLKQKHSILLDAQVIDALHELACNTIKSFPEVFSTTTFSELPVAGLLNGAVVSARIDKVIVTESVVKIIDFKTDRDLSGDKSKYAKQLGIYKKLLQPIYSQHDVKCYVLWVRHGVLQELIEF